MAVINADPLEDFEVPADWTPAAIETFREVLTARPNLDGPEIAALEQAAELISSAARLSEVARDRGYVATGSQGQEILHPAVTEARLSRTAAASILARLVPDSPSGNLTNSERARQAARARWARR